MTALTDRQRWIALIVLCLGSFMIVLDTTIVNVALPSIRNELGFSESSLAWVVNAYILFFGGFLLLGGRLGDLYGQRRVFLAGITLFTIASVAAGASLSQPMLVIARAAQGLGGALASAVGFSLIITLFTDPAERAKAMGIAGFVPAGGGSVGVLLGGVLTSIFGWHAVFLVNVPIGLAVYVFSLRCVPGARATSAGARLDVAGAIAVTASVMTAVYAIVNGNQVGWTSPQTLVLLGVGVILLCAFVVIESRVAEPLMPLGLFRLRNLATSNAMGVLWAAAMFAWFFLSALYLQLVLGYTPLAVGLAFLPGNVLMAILSVGVSARLVMRFGIQRPLGIGLALAGLGLALLVRAPVGGDYVLDVLPSMLLLGLGAGMAFNPMLLAAMGDVRPHEAGLASVLVNTSFMLGGALGLAVLASVASAQTNAAAVAGEPLASALTSGYHAAFAIGAAFAIVAATLGVKVLRIAPQLSVVELEQEEAAA